MITASNLLVRIPPLFSDLAKILAGEIDCTIETLTRYGTDGSPFLVLPQAIIYPKHSTDIKHVLAFAREYKMPITVRGEGTSKTGGSLGEGIILDMTRYFSQIRNINMVENTITVDAGVDIPSLVKKLHAWHFDIPLITAHQNTGTVGAFIATKPTTGSSFTHGTIREWIEELTVVVDNGEEHKIADGITPTGRLLGIYQGVFPVTTKESPLLRAVKPKSHDDPTGYNLWSTSIGPRQLIDQITGSEGTLGIITSVTFRIAPHKKHSITTCVPIFEKKYIPIYADIAKHHHAEHIFIYDEAFMQLSERYHPSLTPFFPDVPYALLVTHTSTDKEKLHHAVTAFKRALPVQEHFLKTLEGFCYFSWGQLHKRSINTSNIGRWYDYSSSSSFFIFIRA
jgi:FAD/FMN-containing dehydrogenase